MRKPHDFCIRDDLPRAAAVSLRHHLVQAVYGKFGSSAQCPAHMAHIGTGDGNGVNRT